MTTLNLQVGASEDDSAEASGGTNNITEIDTQINASGQWAGFRFTNVTIPQGSTINSATLKIWCESSSEAIANIVDGQAADDAAAFVSSSNNISGRTGTAASVSWTDPSFSNGFADVPSVATIVQEIVDRGGWVSGNSLVLRVAGNNSGDLYVHFYDDSSSFGAKLDIDYTAGATGQTTAVLRRDHQTIGVRYRPARVDAALFERTITPPTGEAEPSFVPFVRGSQYYRLIDRKTFAPRYPTLVPLRMPIPPTGEEPGESTAPLLNKLRRNDAMHWADAHFRQERRASAQLLSTMANPPLPPPPPTIPPTAAVGSGPFMGGHKIMRAYWISQSALRIEFSSSYGSAYHYQLYAGRCLIGTTSSPAQRIIVGHLQPATWPPHLTLLGVDLDQRLTDYGDTLPPRPYNRVKLQFTASSWPADAKYIDVTAGTTPGGAVADSNLIERLLYDTDRQYTLLTKPLPGTGTWNFEVFGRDSRLSGGNAGDVLELSQAVLAHPPDVALNSDGSRLTVAVESQVATVTFTYP